MQNTTTSQVSFIYLFFRVVYVLFWKIVVVRRRPRKINNKNGTIAPIFLMDVRTQMVSTQRLMRIQYTIFHLHIEAFTNCLFYACLIV